MLRIRPAQASDFDFLYRVDVRDEGITEDHRSDWTEAHWEEHSRLVRSFTTDSEKVAFICEDEEGAKCIGLVMASFRTLAPGGLQAAEGNPAGLDRTLLPADGRYCEIYQLWVHPEYRRRGLATALKRHVEVAAIRRGIGLIYTHTEAINRHIVELNLKMGYRQVRRAPLRSGVEHVSLVKKLQSAEVVVAACGLVCSNCGMYLRGKCQGCFGEVTAFRNCRVKACVREAGIPTCAHCTTFPDPRRCSILNNPIAWLLGRLFGTSRLDNLDAIREMGMEAFKAERLMDGRK